jgi:D-arabinose 5-phosphate isomerase GutQ
MTPPLGLPGALLVSPDELDDLATHARALGHQVDAIGAAVSAALAKLADAAPGSALSAAVPAARASCPQVLASEASRLRQLGDHLRLAAAAYRANEGHVSARAARVTW